MSFKVVVTDHPWEDLEVERSIFEGNDINLIGHRARSGNLPNEHEVIEMAHDADAIIHFDAEITGKVIKELENCKVIVRQAVGYSNIDLKAAYEKQIYVANSPTYCTREVATHAISLLLASWRRLKEQEQVVREHGWDLPEQEIHRISNATLGLLAFGRISRTVAERMAGFGVDIVGYDPFVNEEIVEGYDVELVSLQEVFQRSDMISCHVPLFDSSRGMVNGDLFRKAKKGLILVNTSRAEIFERKALMNALRDGTISAAGFDVWFSEPIGKDDEIREFDNIILTPHTAFYSEEAKKEDRETSAREVLRVFNGNPPNAWLNHWEGTYSWE